MSDNDVLTQNDPQPNQFPTCPIARRLRRKRVNPAQQLRLSRKNVRGGLPKKTFKTRSPKKALTALMSSIADANAQISEGYRPVSDPGRRKFNDSVNGDVDLSYVDSDPCPDASCSDPECRTHRKDLALKFDDDSDSDSEYASAEEPEDAPVFDPEEDSQEDVPNERNDFAYQAFSKRVPHQFEFWPTYVCFMLAFLLPTIFVHYVQTGGRSSPLYYSFQNCTEIIPDAPQSWFNPFHVLQFVNDTIRYDWCRLSVWTEHRWILLTTRSIFELEWFFGIPHHFISTPSTGRIYSNHGLALIYALFGIVICFGLTSTTRRSYFKVKFRRSGLILGCIALVFNIYCLTPAAEHSFFGDVRSFSVREAPYNYCPDCLPGTVMFAKRLDYDFSRSMIHALWSLLVLFFVSFGPDYRIHFVPEMATQEDWDARFRSSFDDRFSHNKRGERNQAVAADYITVTTFKTHWLRIRRYTTDKWSNVPRDMKLVSMELLRESLNPSSLSPIIDRSTAVDRIVRAATNNQTVNVSKFALSAGYDVYGASIAYAVEVRAALFDRMARSSDYDSLNPP